MSDTGEQPPNCYCTGQPATNDNCRCTNCVGWRRKQEEASLHPAERAAREYAAVATVRCHQCRPLAERVTVLERALAYEPPPIEELRQYEGGD